MIFYIILGIIATIGLVWLIDKFIPSKFRPIVMIVLWVIIGVLGYQTFMSVYNPILFNKVKDKRYAKVIDKLIDIRDAQLAHRQVTGKFSDNFDIKKRPGTLKQISIQGNFFIKFSILQSAWKHAD